MVWLVIWALLIVVIAFYELAVKGPRRRKARAAQKQQLFR